MAEYSATCSALASINFFFKIKLEKYKTINLKVEKIEKTLYNKLIIFTAFFHKIYHWFIIVLYYITKLEVLKKHK